MDPLFIIYICILIFSIVLHELAHGYAAYWLGDPTAQYEGRLTLNPFKHLEWFGSLILPVISYQLGGFLIGWAKPIPYNPYNFKRFARFGDALVAFAGPAINIIFVIAFSIIYRVLVATGGSAEMIVVSEAIVLVNLVLAAFNLLPFPPLDGSKILFSVLPRKYDNIKYTIDRYSLPVALVFLIFVWPIVSPYVFVLARLILGV